MSDRNRDDDFEMDEATRQRLAAKWQWVPPYTGEEAERVAANWQRWRESGYTDKEAEAAIYGPREDDE
ncbi:MAG: hypothetical protein F4Y75_06495 [Acidimicrobiia bacterium]|nr:hypothetical protein [bacterium]MXX64048.1 hypothetical protein [Acidimicrobiia bacterium]MCY3579345.1 hypothetical protein [bacterium]MCY3653334.1 hypothetical protein [bacterium]MDE0644108.1 hypothetical protein [bacterium]